MNTEKYIILRVLTSLIQAIYVLDSLITARFNLVVPVQGRAKLKLTVARKLLQSNLFICKIHKNEVLINLRAGSVTAFHGQEAA